MNNVISGLSGKNGTIMTLTEDGDILLEGRYGLKKRNAEKKTKPEQLTQSIRIKSKDIRGLTNVSMPKKTKVFFIIWGVLLAIILLGQIIKLIIM